MVIRITYPNHGHGSDFLCFFFCFVLFFFFFLFFFLFFFDELGFEKNISKMTSLKQIAYFIQRKFFGLTIVFRAFVMWKHNFAAGRIQIPQVKFIVPLLSSVT